ncbi:5'-nucleotidase domain-containing protein 1 [Diorhabda sublineata]|uniref:5'-nucleotidase domain-containing protein 1 n=1 Tax=Diorhabda sublineata TaxID=1163346 RepID=UPI0024E11823|nr:5'-nucleotidase domain-containing protein 1 [Diorhabda sublineata]
MWTASSIVSGFSKLCCRSFLNSRKLVLKHNRTFCYNSVKKELNNKPAFSINDYDCIGFDLDNTLARYKIGNMLEMEYKIVSNYLVTQKNYPTEDLLKPIDPNFFIKGLIIDDENGNIIRIGPDGTILQATHGTRWLSKEEILHYYPTLHWHATDLFVENPLQTWNGPYSEKMRTLLDYFDIVISLVFARAVDSIDKLYGRRKVYNIWPDLLNALMYMFNREHYETDTGEYFPEMKKNPDHYYYSCTPNLINWLQELRNTGKKLYLITGAHADFANHTATSTLGPNWRDYFDIVVSYAKKPGFFILERDFIGLDESFKETGPVTNLQKGAIYTHGNWKGLKDFLINSSNISNPKFVYIGDNLVQDIYTPNVHSHCDTVSVCEELEAENTYDYLGQHPDKYFLSSTLWGSYFQCKYSQERTIWYTIMKNNSKICVPSIEYLAKYPLDHQFQCLIC